jgi:hypothetical protein
MSVRSGFAAAGIGIVLLFVGAGFPIWEARIDNSTEQATWSYGLFSARHEGVNESTLTDCRPCSYGELAPIQERMSAVFTKFQLYVALGVIAAISGMVLAAVTRAGRVHGVFAGLAFAGASSALIFATFELLFAIPAAASDVDPRIVNLAGRVTDNSLSWGPGMGLFLPIGSGLAFARASSDLWHLRPAKKSTPMRAGVAAKGSAPEGLVRLPPPPIDPTPARFREPRIEEVFVIGSNGLLVKHMSRTLMTDKDRDVVGSMISAISSFVREAFSERDGEVHEVSLGDHRFVMCNERGIVAAVLVTSGQAEDIVPRLRHLLTLLLDRYGPRLVQWHGEPLEGIEDELNVLWEPFHLPPPPAE